MKLERLLFGEEYATERIWGQVVLQEDICVSVHLESVVLCKLIQKTVRERPCDEVIKTVTFILIVCGGQEIKEYSSH